MATEGCCVATEGACVLAAEGCCVLAAEGCCVLAAEGCCVDAADCVDAASLADGDAASHSVRSTTPSPFVSMASKTSPSTGIGTCPWLLWEPGAEPPPDAGSQSRGAASDTVDAAREGSGSGP